VDAAVGDSGEDVDGAARAQRGEPPAAPSRRARRSVASLDILSGGRVELGLGAGAFWDAIAANGGPRLRPGESVDALSEAIDITRALWHGRTVRVDGEHYHVHGAKPGPRPAHDVEIWVGAYKRRMLRLTGAKADGWLPSMSYLDLADVPGMNERIDRAAIEAGRSPAEIRRLINVNPDQDADELARLAHDHGFSTLIMSVSSADDVRRFAQETAPAVRELVMGGGAPPPPRVSGEAAPFSVTPTPDDGRRVSSAAPWDEGTRPTGPERDASRRYTPEQQAAGQHLIDVHDGLRAELERLRDLIGQVAAGHRDPAAVRSFINRMTIRQNGWTLGAFCLSYCRVVATHHTLEDRSVFPHLRAQDTALAAVLDRLEEEHEVIAELLERIDAAMVGLIAGDDGMGELQAVADLFTDALLSHLSYEERELVEPLARLGFY
jgi:alkanesulfonate monooxygenase SsuD/methylene tetrahydromethanopterin reductase-like flavin-dependent oxidoreductase (luciferase family)